MVDPRPCLLFDQLLAGILQSLRWSHHQGTGFPLKAKYTPRPMRVTDHQGKKNNLRSATRHTVEISAISRCVCPRRVFQRPATTSTDRHSLWNHYLTHRWRVLRDHAAAC